MTSTNSEDGAAIIIVAVILMLFSVCMAFVHFNGYFNFKHMDVIETKENTSLDAPLNTTQEGGAVPAWLAKTWNTSVDGSKKYASSEIIHLVSGISYILFAAFSAWMIWAGRKIKGYYA